MSRVLDRVKAVRWNGAEFRVSLNQRRAWYADEPQQQVTGEGQPAAQPEAPADQMPDWVSDPAKAYGEIKKLREESAKHRTTAADLAKRLDAIARQQQQGEEQKLAEANNWKALAEKRASELEQMKAETRKAMIEAVAAQYGLPDELAARLQGETRDELRADAEKLSALLPKPAPGGQKPNTTAAVPGGQPAKETDAQRRARLFGGGTNVFAGGTLVAPEDQ